MTDVNEGFFLTEEKESHPQLVVPSHIYIPSHPGLALDDSSSKGTNGILLQHDCDSRPVAPDHDLLFPRRIIDSDTSAGERKLPSASSVQGIIPPVESHAPEVAPYSDEPSATLTAKNFPNIISVTPGDPLIAGETDLNTLQIPDTGPPLASLPSDSADGVDHDQRHVELKNPVSRHREPDNQRTANQPVDGDSHRDSSDLRTETDSGGTAGGKTQGALKDLTTYLANAEATCRKEVSGRFADTPVFKMVAQAFDRVAFRMRMLQTEGTVPVAEVLSLANLMHRSYPKSRVVLATALNIVDRLCRSAAPSAWSTGEVLMLLDFFRGPPAADKPPGTPALASELQAQPDLQSKVLKVCVWLSASLPLASLDADCLSHLCRILYQLGSNSAEDSRGIAIGAVQLILTRLIDETRPEESRITAARATGDFPPQVKVSLIAPHLITPFVITAIQAVSRDLLPGDTIPAVFGDEPLSTETLEERDTVDGSTPPCAHDAARCRRLVVTMLDLLIDEVSNCLEQRVAGLDDEAASHLAERCAEEGRLSAEAFLAMLQILEKSNTERAEEQTATFSLRSESATRTATRRLLSTELPGGDATRTGVGAVMALDILSPLLTSTLSQLEGGMGWLVDWIRTRLMDPCLRVAGCIGLVTLPLSVILRVTSLLLQVLTMPVNNSVVGLVFFPCEFVLATHFLVSQLCMPDTSSQASIKRQVVAVQFLIESLLGNVGVLQIILMSSSKCPHSAFISKVLGRLLERLSLLANENESIRPPHVRPHAASGVEFAASHRQVTGIPLGPRSEGVSTTSRTSSATRAGINPPCPPIPSGSAISTSASMPISTPVWSPVVNQSFSSIHSPDIALSPAMSRNTKPLATLPLLRLLGRGDGDYWLFTKTPAPADVGIRLGSGAVANWSRSRMWIQLSGIIQSGERKEPAALPLGLTAETAAVVGSIRGPPGMRALESARSDVIIEAAMIATSSLSIFVATVCKLIRDKYVLPQVGDPLGGCDREFLGDCEEAIGWESLVTPSGCRLLRRAGSSPVESETGQVVSRALLKLLVALSAKSGANLGPLLDARIAASLISYAFGDYATPLELALFMTPSATGGAGKLTAVTEAGVGPEDPSPIAAAKAAETMELYRLAVHCGSRLRKEHVEGLEHRAFATLNEMSEKMDVPFTQMLLDWSCWCPSPREVLMIVAEALCCPETAAVPVLSPVSPAVGANPPRPPGSLDALHSLLKTSRFFLSDSQFATELQIRRVVVSVTWPKILPIHEGATIKLTRFGCSQEDDGIDATAEVATPVADLFTGINRFQGELLRTQWAMQRFASELVTVAQAMGPETTQIPFRAVELCGMLTDYTKTIKQSRTKMVVMEMMAHGLRRIEQPAIVLMIISFIVGYALICVKETAVAIQVLGFWARWLTDVPLHVRNDHCRLLWDATAAMVGAASHWAKINLSRTSQPETSATGLIVPPQTPPTSSSSVSVENSTVNATVGGTALGQAPTVTAQIKRHLTQHITGCVTVLIREFGTRIEATSAVLALCLETILVSCGGDEPGGIEGNGFDTASAATATGSGGFVDSLPRGVDRVWSKREKHDINSLKSISLVWQVCCSLVPATVGRVPGRRRNITMGAGLHYDKKEINIGRCSMVVTRITTEPLEAAEKISSTQMTLLESVPNEPESLLMAICKELSRLSRDGSVPVRLSAVKSLAMLLGLPPIASLGDEVIVDELILPILQRVHVQKIALWKDMELTACCILRNDDSVNSDTFKIIQDQLETCDETLLAAVDHGNIKANRRILDQLVVFEKELLKVFYDGIREILRADISFHLLQKTGPSTEVTRQDSKATVAQRVLTSFIGRRMMGIARPIQWILEHTEQTDGPAAAWSLDLCQQFIYSLAEIHKTFKYRIQDLPNIEQATSIAPVGPVIDRLLLDALAEAVNKFTQHRMAPSGLMATTADEGVVRIRALAEDRVAGDPGVDVSSEVSKPHHEESRALSPPTLAEIESAATPRQTSQPSSKWTGATTILFVTLIKIMLGLQPPIANCEFVLPELLCLDLSVGKTAVGSSDDEAVPTHPQTALSDFSALFKLAAMPSTRTPNPQLSDAANWSQQAFSATGPIFSADIVESRQQQGATIESATGNSQAPGDSTALASSSSSLRSVPSTSSPDFWEVADFRNVAGLKSSALNVPASFQNLCLFFSSTKWVQELRAEEVLCRPYRRSAARASAFPQSSPVTTADATGPYYGDLSDPMTAGFNHSDIASSATMQPEAADINMWQIFNQELVRPFVQADFYRCGSRTEARGTAKLLQCLWAVTMLWMITRRQKERFDNWCAAPPIDLAAQLESYQELSSDVLSSLMSTLDTYSTPATNTHEATSTAGSSPVVLSAGTSPGVGGPKGSTLDTHLPVCRVVMETACTLLVNQAMFSVYMLQRLGEIEHGVSRVVANLAHHSWEAMLTLRQTCSGTLLETATDSLWLWSVQNVWCRILGHEVLAPQIVRAVVAASHPGEGINPVTAWGAVLTLLLLSDKQSNNRERDLAQASLVDALKGYFEQLKAATQPPKIEASRLSRLNPFRSHAPAAQFIPLPVDVVQRTVRLLEAVASAATWWPKGLTQAVAKEMLSLIELEDRPIRVSLRTALNTVMDVQFHVVSEQGMCEAETKGT